MQFSPIVEKTTVNNGQEKQGTVLPAEAAFPQHTHNLTITVETQHKFFCAPRSRKRVHTDLLLMSYITTIFLELV